MQKLNLPNYSFRIENKEDKKYIFDPIRRKKLLLTPEEWVRQHFVRFLVQEKQVPEGLLCNEYSLNINGIKKRCDTVIFNTLLQALTIVEYKAPQIKITQKVFDQIAAYNIQLKVPLLIVSNGIEHYCCTIEPHKNKVTFLQDIPGYNEMLELIK